MISDEAVEAAAKALLKKFNGYEVARPWDSRYQQTTYRNDAIAALEAAAPHMFAEVWGKGHGAGWNDCLLALQNDGAKFTPNPYRSQA